MRSGCPFIYEAAVAVEVKKKSAITVLESHYLEGVW
jgi:hypothetical protein